jgi:four helix bundle protein
MNNPEITMPQPTTPIHYRLRAHEVALEAAGIVLQLAVRVPAPLRPVADQAIRTASSVVLNLAEGQGRIGRDRQHYWRIAYGSALETESALSLLQAADCFDDREATRAIELLDRVRAMAWRLMHPKSER